LVKRPSLDDGVDQIAEIRADALHAGGGCRDAPDCVARYLIHVAVERGEEQFALAAEGTVEAAGAELHLVAEGFNRGRLEAVTPKYLDRPVEHHQRIKITWPSQFSNPPCRSRAVAPRLAAEHGNYKTATR
jgi:hypothetical protein